MLGKLEGKVVLVSGGGRGMGAAEARLFAREGAKVVIGDVLVEEAHRVAAEIGDSAHVVELDVTSESSWELAVKETIERFGMLNVLVNNAGIMKYMPISMMSLDDYMSVILVNQIGVFLGMRAVISALMESSGDAILDVSSTGGLGGTPFLGAYCASKFAVTGMTKVAAIELAELGIRVNAIHPGPIRTPLIDMPGIDIEAAISAAVPMARIGEPDEIARLALFLVSDDSSYCTGSSFVADGGQTAGTGGDAFKDI